MKKRETKSVPLRRRVPGTAFFTGQPPRPSRRCEESRYLATLGDTVSNRVSAIVVGHRGRFPEGRFPFRSEKCCPSGKSPSWCTRRACQKAGVGIQGQGRWTATAGRDRNSGFQPPSVQPPSFPAFTPPASSPALRSQCLRHSGDNPRAARLGNWPSAGRGTACCRRGWAIPSG